MAVPILANSIFVLTTCRARGTEISQVRDLKEIISAITWDLKSQPSHVKGESEVN